MEKSDPAVQAGPRISTAAVAPGMRIARCKRCRAAIAVEHAEDARGVPLMRLIFQRKCKRPRCSIYGVWQRARP
jgi:hypothetical protein